MRNVLPYAHQLGNLRRLIECRQNDQICTHCACFPPIAHDTPMMGTCKAFYWNISLEMVHANDYH